MIKLKSCAASFRMEETMYLWRYAVRSVTPNPLWMLLCASGLFQCCIGKSPPISHSVSWSVRRRATPCSVLGAPGLRRSPSWLDWGLRSGAAFCVLCPVFGYNSSLLLLMGSDRVLHPPLRYLLSQVMVTQQQTLSELGHFHVIQYTTEVQWHMCGLLIEGHSGEISS